MALRTLEGNTLNLLNPKLYSEVLINTFSLFIVFVIVEVVMVSLFLFQQIYIYLLNIHYIKINFFILVP